MRKVFKGVAVAAASAAAIALATPAASAAPSSSAVTQCTDLHLADGAWMATVCKSWWRVRPGVYNGKWWTKDHRMYTAFWVDLDGNQRRVYHTSGTFTGARYLYLRVCDVEPGAKPWDCSGWW
jgi:hypothetical protein